MRYGRESSSKRHDGHKAHVLEEESTEIILHVDVGAGNCRDGDHAAPLIEEAQEAGVTVDEVVGDMATATATPGRPWSRPAPRWIARLPPASNSG